MSKTNRKNDGKGLTGHGIRNEMAISAWNRKAGPMEDRRRERGGARNYNRDFLSNLE
jgi:hypothetical protein